METTKIMYKKTGVIKEVKKSLASDFINTGDFVIAGENKDNTSYTSRLKNYTEKEKEEK